VLSVAEEAPDLHGGWLEVTRHLAAKIRAMTEYAGDPGPASAQEYLAVLRAPADGARFWAVEPALLAKNG
jgi:hypothetical protein